MHFDLEQASKIFESDEGKELADNITHLAQELKEIQNIYESATKEITTKLEILDGEFEARNKRNPIHSI